MKLDEQVSRILVEMTEDLTPAPDPYGRVRARYRRRQRRRLTGAGLGVVAAVSLAGGAVAVAGIGTGPGRVPDPPAASPPVFPNNRERTNFQAWINRLVKSPPRGAVAGDSGFVADLSERLTQSHERHDYHVRGPRSTTKVLFVDDVGPHRMVIAAFIPVRDPYHQVALMMSFSGRRGASAEDLAQAAVTNGQMQSLNSPFVRATSTRGARSDDFVTVSVVPAGCQFESAAWPQVSDWRREPTGSYLVVPTSQGGRPQWRRVTCDGVVRWMAPARGTLAPNGITDADFARAMSRVRGKVNATLSRAAMTEVVESWGLRVTALPAVVWNGRTDGAVPWDGLEFEGAATVLAAPAPGGGWRGAVHIKYGRKARHPGNSTTAPFSTRTDPADPSSVVVIPLGVKASTLVVTPAGATAVKVVRDGKVVAQAPVRDAGAVLNTRIDDKTVVQAVDAAGGVVGTGRLANEPLPVDDIDRWHQD